MTNNTSHTGKMPTCLLSICLAATLLTGCGGGDNLDRQPVSGTVTHDGQPVPNGSIWFEPDASLGTTAPTGFAVIRDGRFETRRESSPMPGQYTLRISGFDASQPPPGALEDGLEPDEIEYPPLFPEFTERHEIPPPGGTLEIVAPTDGR